MTWSGVPRPKASTDIAVIVVVIVVSAAIGAVSSRLASLLHNHKLSRMSGIELSVPHRLLMRAMRGNGIRRTRSSATTSDVVVVTLLVIRIIMPAPAGKFVSELGLICLLFLV